MGLYYKKKKIAGINFLPRLTLAEYNNLTVKPKYWIRTDTPDGYLRLNATNVSYDNSINVKDKIDEVDLTDGGTVTGNLNIKGISGINNVSTTTSETKSLLQLGNNTAIGSVGNSTGRIVMYGDKTSAVVLEPSSNMSSGNKSIYFPDKSGTLALLDFGLLMAQANIPTTATSYDCNWGNYKAIVCYTGNYGNFRGSIIVPTDWFNGTSDGTRIMLVDPISSIQFSIWQNGTTKVTVQANTQNSTQYLRIYGIL